MNYGKLTIILALILLVGVFEAPQAYAVSEVTGTLTAGASGDNNSGTISGTVTGGSSGGGGVGGGSSGGGSVLGASTTNSGTPQGQVLGVSTPGFPVTGMGLLDSLIIISLALIPLVGYKLLRDPEVN